MIKKIKIILKYDFLRFFLRKIEFVFLKDEITL